MDEHQQEHLQSTTALADVQRTDSIVARKQQLEESLAHAAITRGNIWNKQGKIDTGQMKLQVLQSTKESIIRRKVGELTMRQLDDNSNNDATDVCLNES